MSSKLHGSGSFIFKPPGVSLSLSLPRSLPLSPSLSPSLSLALSLSLSPPSLSLSLSLSLTQGRPAGDHLFPACKPRRGPHQGRAFAMSVLLEIPRRGLPFQVTSFGRRTSFVFRLHVFLEDVPSQESQAGEASQSRSPTHGAPGPHWPHGPARTTDHTITVLSLHNYIIIV